MRRSHHRIKNPKAGTQLRLYEVSLTRLPRFAALRDVEPALLCTKWSEDYDRQVRSPHARISQLQLGHQEEVDVRHRRR